MSAASRATSDPLPIAMPQSAARSAGASLTPSPVTQTTPPRACMERTIRKDDFLVRAQGVLLLRPERVEFCTRDDDALR